MTIRGIGSGGTYTQAFTSTEARVAVLLLENEEQQQEIDQQLLDSTRARYAAASEAEVAAMRAEADHLFQGALVQAGIGVAGAGLQLASVRAEGAASERAAGLTCMVAKAQEEACAKTWGTFRSIGEGATSGLASAANQALGESRVAADRAEARAEAGLAKQAEWEMEDRKKALDESQGDQDRAVRWLSQLVEGEAALQQAVLSNLA